MTRAEKRFRAAARREEIKNMLAAIIVSRVLKQLPNDLELSWDQYKTRLIDIASVAHSEAMFPYIRGPEASLYRDVSDAVIHEAVAAIMESDEMALARAHYRLVLP